MREADAMKLIHFKRSPKGKATETDATGNNQERHFDDPLADLFRDPHEPLEPRDPYDVDPGELLSDRLEAAEAEAERLQYEANKRYERRHRSDYIEEILGEMDGTIGDEEPYVDPDAHHHDRWAAQDNARFRDEAARRRR